MTSVQDSRKLASSASLVLSRQNIRTYAVRLQIWIRQATLSRWSMSYCSPMGKTVSSSAALTGMARGSGTSVVRPATLGTDIPPALDAEAAATLPNAFLTAHHCLIRTARLQRGERVLIHAGAGGVGMAAIQLALDAGAEVFTTAGSE